MSVRLAGPPEGESLPALDTAALAERAGKLLRELGYAESELSVALVGDASMTEMNGQYRGRPGPTDVLSFSLLEGDHAEQRGDLGAADRQYAAALVHEARGPTRNLGDFIRARRVRVAWKRGARDTMRKLLEDRAGFEATPGAKLHAQCFRALLAEDEVAPAIALLGMETVAPDVEMEARFLLWEATRDETHLSEAHRLHRQLRDATPDDYRESLLSLPLHEDIMKAWEEHGETA